MKFTKNIILIILICALFCLVVFSKKSQRSSRLSNKPDEKFNNGKGKGKGKGKGRKLYALFADVNESWEEYKQDFLAALTGDKLQKKKDIFQKNVKKLQERAKKWNKHALWKEGINSFTHLSIEEKRSRLIKNHKTPNMKNFKKNHVAPSAEEQARMDAQKKEFLELAKKEEAEEGVAHPTTTFRFKEQNSNLRKKSKTNASLHAQWTQIEALGYSPIDLRNLFPEIQNQMKCGSCVPFALLSVVDANMRKKFNTPNTYLSVQQQVSCNALNDGCNGGNTEEALDYIINNGALAWNTYPYSQESSENGNSMACNNDIVKNNKPIVKVSGYYGCNYETGNPCESKMYWQYYLLKNYGPVSSYITVNDGFYDYQEGIYDPLNAKIIDGWSQEQIEQKLREVCQKPTNHAVTIVGFGRDYIEGSLWWKKYADYFLVRNTWGTDWGIDGYFKMGYNPLTETCGLGTAVFFPIVEKP